MRANHLSKTAAPSKNIKGLIKKHKPARATVEVSKLPLFKKQNSSKTIHAPKPEFPATLYLPETLTWLHHQLIYE